MNNAISPVSATPVAPMAEPAPARPVKAVVAEPAPPPAEKQAVDHGKLAEVSRRELQEAIERLNEQVKKNSYNLNFSVDEASDYVVVKIRDVNNGEVIRQIPSETVLRLAENLKGLLQDEKI